MRIAGLPKSYKIGSLVLMAGVYLFVYNRVDSATTASSYVVYYLLLAISVYLTFVSYYSGIYVTRDTIIVRNYITTVQVPRSQAKFAVSNWKNPWREYFGWPSPSVFAMIRMDTEHHSYAMPYTLTTQSNAKRVAAKLNDIIGFSSASSFHRTHVSGPVIENKILRLAELGFENPWIYPIWSIVNRKITR